MGAQAAAACRGPAAGIVPSDAYCDAALQWAAITLIIVGTAEYVGAAAWIAMQRLTGNIIGGYLGYAGQRDSSTPSSALCVCWQYSRPKGLDCL